ncbi:MAG: hypothetical protein C0424_01255 [Sphingobacteriaceae bacterium]|nr:hypothetical protein [Sphingobacteriaceae bacterium]
MQTFILPPTAAEDLVLAQTRLWLNALSPLAAPNSASFQQIQAEISSSAFIWQAGPANLLEADWLAEVAWQTPSVWYIHCTEMSTPPARGSLFCIEKTEEKGLLLRRFDYHMQFNERLVQWQWLELLARQHQSVVWGTMAGEQ